MVQRPTIDDVRDAHDRIRPFIHRTPVHRSREFDEELGCSVFFKCENFQKVGAFKARGALNAILALDDKVRSHGVITHSSGNHGAALAYGAAAVGVSCTVVMPDSAPRIKIDAVRGYGAEIVFCPQSERQQVCDREIEARGASLIHPFNNPAVIAGQGTVALELIEDVGPLDVVLAPVGGGGLLSGTAVTVSALLPRAIIRGAEPMRLDDAYQSLQSGVLQPGPERPDSWADGLLTGLGELPFVLLRERGVQVIRVEEDEMLAANRAILERLKIVVEPSAATALAALQRVPELISGKRVGVILSGGNTDLAWLCPV